MEGLKLLLKDFFKSLAIISKCNLQPKEFRFQLKCAILKVKAVRFSSCTVLGQIF